jgi:hypothetical protein
MKKLNIVFIFTLEILFLWTLGLDIKIYSKHETTILFRKQLCIFSMST